MRSITYIDPKVKLIDCVDPSIGFETWCKSKESVVHIDDDGVHIGKDTKSIAKYYDEIMRMNMQYNNLPYFIFEVTGSVLFRDILYNINKTNQWAVSLRLVHSTVDRSDPANFGVSSEYANIKEWDDAFWSYFEVVQHENRTDKNRVTMPYSLSSTYWIGMNYKTLVSFISVLKYKMPFFYQAYGQQFVKAYNDIAPYDAKIENYLTPNIETGLTKLFSKDPTKFEESCTKVDDYYLVKQDIAMILYSQFIRQADVDVRGLWDELVHTDVEEFKHKVFTGDTVLHVTYLAHEDRVRKTLIARQCWFSQSDGDEKDPRYWSKFINTFLSGVDSPEEFAKYLPCKFRGCNVVSCKYKEDVKFRDEGLQDGYIPCAILNRNPEYARKRLEGSDNRLNRNYLRLTEHLVNDGLVRTEFGEFWTSNLTISAECKLGDITQDQIRNTIISIGALSTKWSNPEQLPEDLECYKSFDHDGDNTCYMKGYAINKIADILLSTGHKKFIINFGGDLFIYNATVRVPIKNTKFILDLSGIYSVFTSGNMDNERGNHIIGGDANTQCTIVAKWVNNGIENALIDAMATKTIAKELTKLTGMMDYLHGKAEIYAMVFEDGKLRNPTYCASPFFNPKQIEIRDNMVSQFLNAFRPDLTPESVEYNDHHENSYVGPVVDANIRGIDETEFLVFPNRTTDLGTLYEVGKALSYGHAIIRYDEYEDKYHVCDTPITQEYKDDQKYLFSCNNKRDVISLGYLSSKVPAENIYYELNGSPDNIMLSYYYNHVEKDERGVYQTIIRNDDERDV